MLAFSVHYECVKCNNFIATEQGFVGTAVMKRKINGQFLSTSLK